MNLTAEHIVRILPQRLKDANKGTFGKVLVIAGSKDFPGAAELVCEGAYRIGAGLVTLVASRDVYQIAATKLRELTFIDLADDALSVRISEFDAIAIGPGLGMKPATQKFLEDFFEQENLPKLIIDADALNALSVIENWWKRYNFQAVLTPHPKEMSRLTKLSMEEIQEKRQKVAAEYSALWGQVVVLKGANTIIASPDQEASVSPFANPLLATAGTGDVLTGVIAGFVAQGMELFDAARAGVFVHGQAGEMLKEQFGESGMMASDLLLALTQALQKFRGIK